MDLSIFMDKAQRPDDTALKKVLCIKYYLWMDLRDYVFANFPLATEEWNFSGVKYGWSFRIKDTKRAIIYLLPQDKSFKIALVYGQKATDQAFNSSVSDEVKKIIETAPVYAEGRGFRIEVKDEKILPDLKLLIDIKLKN